jgi:hypothetical protein
MLCPACNKPDLEPIRYIPFIAENGDTWICHNCGCISTDFAVYMFNKN